MPRPLGATVKIQQTGVSPREWRVWVNGQDLTEHCRAWAVDGAIDEITLLTLELLVEELDLEVVGLLDRYQVVKEDA